LHGCLTHKELYREDIAWGAHVASAA